MGRLDRIVIALLVVAALRALSAAWSDGDTAPAPSRPPIVTDRAPTPTPLPPRTGDMVLPPPSPMDPLFKVQIDRRSGSSVGTAFAIDDAGVWLTARHVVQDCGQIGVRGRSGLLRASIAWVHPRADVAVLRTRGGSAPLALSSEALLVGQDGFAIGFPQGRPASVHGRLIGRTQMQAEGRFNGRAPTIAWAEVSRQPSFSGSLGGLSGSPVLDARGNVIGVTVAESPRRGRFESVAPEVLATLTAAERPLRLAPPGGRALALSGQALAQVSDQLRADLRIAQTVCQAR
jgi:serine protease Do